MTPLQQAEQFVMEMEPEEIADEDEHIIEEDQTAAPEEPVEEYIDITSQSIITDDAGIIRDDVIDSILYDVENLSDTIEESDDLPDE